MMATLALFLPENEVADKLAEMANEKVGGRGCGLVQFMSDVLQIQ